MRNDSVHSPTLGSTSITQWFLLHAHTTCKAFPVYPCPPGFFGTLMLRAGLLPFWDTLLHLCYCPQIAMPYPFVVECLPNVAQSPTHDRQHSVARSPTPPVILIPHKVPALDMCISPQGRSCPEPPALLSVNTVIKLLPSSPSLDKDTQDI